MQAVIGSWLPNSLLAQMWLVLNDFCLFYKKKYRMNKFNDPFFGKQTLLHIQG